MDIVVTYDVATDTKAGQKRLRRVAKACEDFGQRVQKSVFECRVNQAQYESLVERLLTEIDSKADSLRIYRLPLPREKHVRVWGRDDRIDPDDTLIL